MLAFRQVGEDLPLHRGKPRSRYSQHDERPEMMILTPAVAADVFLCLENSCLLFPDVAGEITILSKTGFDDAHG